MPSWLTIGCSLLGVRLLALEALAERAKRTGQAMLYRAPLGLRILLSAAIISMVYGAGSVALSDDFKRDWWVSVMLLGSALFCAATWPAELGVSESGLYEKKWLGLRKRVFQWNEIASAALDPSENSVCAVTVSGAMVKHSMYHVDRSGFIAQMTTYGKWLAPGRRL
jgi:hypothetical protein